MNFSERPAARMNLVGGRLCLDFVNTVGGWNPDPARGKNDPFAAVARADKLNDYFDLLAWSLHTNLLGADEAQALAREAGRREKEAAATLRRAAALRGAIYRICAAVIHGAPPRLRPRSAQPGVECRARQSPAGRRRGEFRLGVDGHEERAGSDALAYRRFGRRDVDYG